MLLVEIEGVDGAGKTTLGRGVVEELTRRGVDASFMGFPDGQNTGGRLSRRWLAGERWTDDPIDDAYLHQVAQLGSRLEWLATMERRVAVMDRWYVSTIVYGELDGLPASLSRALLATLPTAHLRYRVAVDLPTSLRRRPPGECDYEAEDRRQLLIDAYERHGGAYTTLDGAREPEALVRRVVADIERRLRR